MSKANPSSKAAEKTSRKLSDLQRFQSQAKKFAAWTPPEDTRALLVLFELLGRFQEEVRNILNQPRGEFVEPLLDDWSDMFSWARQSVVERMRQAKPTDEIEAANRMSVLLDWEVCCGIEAPELMALAAEYATQTAGFDGRGKPGT